MAVQQARLGQYLVVEDGQTPVAVPVIENGRNVTYSFVDEVPTDAVLPPTVQEALSLAGAWSDPDWDEIAEALDRIRHES